MMTPKVAANIHKVFLGTDNMVNPVASCFTKLHKSRRIVELLVTGL